MARWTLALGLFLLTSVPPQLIAGQEVQGAGGPKIIRTPPLVIPCKECLQRGFGGNLEPEFEIQGGSDCCCCDGFEDSSGSFSGSLAGPLASILAGLVSGFGGQGLTFQMPETCDCFCEEPVIIQSPVIETSNTQLSGPQVIPAASARESTALSLPPPPQPLPPAEPGNLYYPGQQPPPPPGHVPYGRSAYNYAYPREPFNYYQSGPVQTYGYGRDSANFPGEVNNNLYSPHPPPSSLPVSIQFSDGSENSYNLEKSSRTIDTSIDAQSSQITVDSNKYQVQPQGSVRQISGQFTKDPSSFPSPVDQSNHYYQNINAGVFGGSPYYKQQFEPSGEISEDDQGYVNPYSKAPAYNPSRGFSVDLSGSQFNRDPSVFYRQNVSPAESIPEKSCPAVSKQSNHVYYELEDNGLRNNIQGFNDDSPWIYVENIDDLSSTNSQISGRNENQYYTNDNWNAKGRRAD